MYSFSFVIPNYNSEKTIDKCLQSVCKIPKDYSYEIIVVDDASLDESVKIIEKYPVCLIKLPKNVGPSTARNIGVEKSKNSIILFLDSDVVVNKNILNRIAKSFDEQGHSCVVGLFSIQNPYKNFSSQYKTLYCNFKYRNIQGPTFFNSAVAAIKKDVFLKIGGFDGKMLVAEDIEFAYRLSKSDYKIYLDNDLEVIHLKKFNFFSLMKNDFRKSTAFAFIYFMSYKKKLVLTKDEFIDISSNSINNIPLVCLSLLFAVFYLVTEWQLSLYLMLGTLVYFFYNNISFWKYLKNHKSIFFTIISIITTFIDYFFVGLGIIKGYILFKNKQIPQ